MNMTDRTHTLAAPTAHRRPRGRAGFSFAEVLFAVIILGIGFILVAAIFPVAIQQTQSTGEDAAAAAAARQACNVIATLPGTYPNPQYNATTAVPTGPSPTYLPTPTIVNLSTLAMFPPTVKNYVPAAGTPAPPAVVTAFSGPRWEAIRDNVILRTDPRYAYVPFYRRENNSQLMQLIVVSVAIRNRTVYNAYQAAGTSYVSDTLPPADAPVTPNPTVTRSSFGSGVCPDTISFSATPPSWVTEGCYTPAYNINSTSLAVGTGRSYRLGRQILGTGNTYELEAGDALAAAAGQDGLWGTSDDVIDGATTVPQSVVPTATLQPTVAYARVFSTPGSLSGRITLSSNLSYAVGTPSGNVAPACAVPGTYVIVADDYAYGGNTLAAASSATYTLPANVTGTPGFTVGSLNGHIFRLGQPVPANSASNPTVDPGTFELDPQTPAPGTQAGGTDVLPTQTGGPRGRVYLVGAGRTDYTTYASPISGPTQDIGIFSGYVPVP
jgi:type II secretory pathway pseudopilin PulG